MHRLPTYHNIKFNKGYDFPVNSKVKSVNSPISITKEQLSKSIDA